MVGHNLYVSEVYENSWNFIFRSPWQQAKWVFVITLWTCLLL